MGNVVRGLMPARLAVRRQRHTPVAGPPEQEGLAPESKEGLLWETYRKFAADGWRLDAAGYSTAFRVRLKVRCRAMLTDCLCICSGVSSSLKSGPRTVETQPADVHAIA